MKYGALFKGVGELVGDKMKSALDPTVFLGLLARVMSAGTALASRRREQVRAAAAAVVTAVPLAHLTLAGRERAMARMGQTRSGLVKDALIVPPGLRSWRYLSGGNRFVMASFQAGQPTQRTRDGTTPEECETVNEAEDSSVPSIVETHR